MQPEETVVAADPTAAATWNKRTQTLLEEWSTRTALAKLGHFELVEKLHRRHTQLGVPAVILASIVGTSLFASLGQDAVDWRLRLLGGFVSIASAVLAGLQTFFRYGELAQRHQVAADWWASANRKINMVLALPPSERGSAKECLDDIRKELARIGQDSPPIGEERWERLATDLLPEANVSRSRVRRAPVRRRLTWARTGPPQRGYESDKSG